jgi:hypothetical protein
LGFSSGAACIVRGGTSTTNHAAFPIVFCSTVSDVVNADVRHVLAAFMSADFGQHKLLKLSHGNASLCHVYFPYFGCCPVFGFAAS